MKSVSFFITRVNRLRRAVERSEEGSEHRGSHLEKSSLRALGEEAIKLCARIVLSMAQREGIAVPGRAKVHFGVD